MTEPLFAVCQDPEPCSFEVTVPDGIRKTALEQAHMTRWHADAPPATDELCDQMVAEHPDEHAVVVMAIETAARMNHGEVDPNFVRSLIPPGTTPQVVSATYSTMRRGGQLEVVRKTPNLDKRGRNTNKEIPVYRLIEQPTVVRA